jgi:hypothetical protein
LRPGKKRSVGRRKKDGKNLDRTSVSGGIGG